MSIKRGSAVALLLPWALFMAFLLWAWRVDDLFHAAPGYGDVLEVVWGVEWYADHFPSTAVLSYPMIFYPHGWPVATFGCAPGLLVALLPLYALGGAVFAHNAGVILAQFVAFAGMYRLARRFTPSSFASTVAALLFAFWGCRWARIYGHLNVLLGTALMPWMAWGLERAFRDARRRWLWLVLVGGLWALALTSILYFAWLGGVLVAGWALGRWIGGRVRWRDALVALCGSTAAAVALSAPVLVVFLQGYAAIDAASYDIYHVNHWGASLNSFPVPFVFHPWLGGWARWLYRGPVDESGVANLGLIASLVALAGSVGGRRERRRWPLLSVVLVGLVLALGLTLKWDGVMVQVPALRSLNGVLWRIGQQLKPALFPTDSPPPPFDTALPLPALMLAILVPFWEAARVLNRFVFVAGIGFFVLVALGLQRVRRLPLRLLLAALLLVEFVPPPSGSVPYPPPPHPAFAWLRENAASGDVVVDLLAPAPGTLALANRPRTLWATREHSLPTVAGTSAVWPAYTAFLNQWLLDHPHPFGRSEFAPLLRAYRADYLLLHVEGENECAMLEEVGGDIALVECFDPPEGPSPWPYSICVLQVEPSRTPALDVVLREGWSTPEGWGVWAVGTTSSARWAATASEDTRIAWEAFPHCVSGAHQTLWLEVNGASVATYRWDGCAPWSGEVVVPADQVHVGWNELRLHAAYAVSPAEASGGANPDPRPLSVGFTRLTVEQ
ncbi:MAG: hypothetical protein JXD18_14315 [Anaerolineae bacterium]|nr:hypothetical protein [Anaerolineae bacterium]